MSENHNNVITDSISYLCVHSAYGSTHTRHMIFIDRCNIYTKIQRNKINSKAQDIKLFRSAVIFQNNNKKKTNIAHTDTHIKCVSSPVYISYFCSSCVIIQYFFCVIYAPFATNIHMYTKKCNNC